MEYSPMHPGLGPKKYSTLEPTSPTRPNELSPKAINEDPQVIHPSSTPFLHIVEPEYSSQGWTTPEHPATLFGTPTPDYIPIPKHAQYQHAPSSEPMLPREQPGGQKIMGLSSRAFWIAAFVVGFLAAAAIGGGIGGTLAASQRRCGNRASNADGETADTGLASGSDPSSGGTSSRPTATTGTTPTSTSAIPAGGSSPAPVDGGCPTINGTTFMPLDAEGKSIPLKASGGTAQTFVRLCRTDFPAGQQYGNEGIHDILKLYVPSLEECIAACAFYNQRYQNKMDKAIPVAGGICKSVTIVKKAAGYCFLKNGTAKPFAKESNPDLTSSAVILEF